MTVPNSAPVTLAAGSFDYDALKGGLGKASRAAAKNYDEAVKAALEEAGDHAFDSRDARAIPGHKFMPVENEELGVTENFQVFDPELAEKEQVDTPVVVPPVAPSNLAAAKDAAASQE